MKSTKNQSNPSAKGWLAYIYWIAGHKEGMIWKKPPQNTNNSKSSNTPLNNTCFHEKQNLKPKKKVYQPKVLGTKCNNMDVDEKKWCAINVRWGLDYNILWINQMVCHLYRWLQWVTADWSIKIF